MNERHKAFCDEYLANGRNGYRAYIAIYGEKDNRDTAEANASRLLTNAKVKEYLKERSEDIAEALGITFEWILKEQRDIYHMAKTKGLYDDKGKLIVPAPDFTGANKALDQLIKLAGLYAPTKTETDLRVKEAPKVDITLDD